MDIEKLSSAIYNNVMSGLRGASINSPFTLEQIEDGIINERMAIIKEYALRNMMPTKDLMYSLRCIKVDCESLDRCPCTPPEADRLKHIEIPQVFSEFGESAIDFIGSTDGLIEYTVYMSNAFRSHKFRRRAANKPYVWIDTTPNQNNMYDAFIFNAAPMLDKLLVRMIPKDPRQVDELSCCGQANVHNITFLSNEIERRLTEKYLRWYRQTAIPTTPNDQTVKA